MFLIISCKVKLISPEMIGAIDSKAFDIVFHGNADVTGAAIKKAKKLLRFVI